MAVYAACTGEVLTPGSAGFRPVHPTVERVALDHWQEQDEAIGRAAGTDTWYDLVDAAGIDIWLSRAGLPRAGRQVVIDSGGHAVLELTAAGGEQWRLTVPARKDTQHEATARYKVTRSGSDGWEALLNGTPGSTTPEQAAALLIGTLTEQGVLPPPAPARPRHAPPAGYPRAAQRPAARNRASACRAGHGQPRRRRRCPRTATGQRPAVRPGRRARHALPLRQRHRHGRGVPLGVPRRPSPSCGRATRAAR